MGVQLDTSASQLSTASARPYALDAPASTARADTGHAPVDDGFYRSAEIAFNPQAAALQRAAFGAGAAQDVSFDAQVRGTDAKPIDFELARLSADVYDVDSAGIEGWTRLDDNALRAAGIDPNALEDSSTGFRAAIYRDAAGNHVLAFAGTNEGQDWLTNLRQGIGLSDAQYNQAMALAQDAKVAFGDDLVITGHSLGGGLAAAAALTTDSAAVTFNAAGVSDATLERAGLDADAAKANAENGQIRRYAVEGEILTVEQEQDLGISLVLPDAPGHKIELNDPRPLGFWERLNPYEVIVGHPVELHMIDAVVEAMANDQPWNAN